MKTILRKIAAAAIALTVLGTPSLLVSCDDYDDTMLWTNVNDLADRLKALETKVSKMNDEIVALRKIAD